MTMYTIINEAAYIIITFNDHLSFSALLDAFLRIAELPGYEYKNRIWIFRQNDEASLSLSTISSVIPVIMGLDPQKKRKSKVAIVLQNGFHSAVTGLFAQEGKTGARHIDLFSNLDSAVQWVTGGKEVTKRWGDR
jgi:hypothetical protein